MRKDVTQAPPLAGVHSVYEKERGPTPRDRTWLRVGVAVAAVGWGANQFAPLLLMYRSELGLSASTVQATFGLYAVGLVPGLLLGGPVSDRHGRRRVVLPALAASLLGTALLIAGGSGVGWLFAGRLVSGLASGAAFSAGAAWIKELSPAARDGGASPGARRVTVTMTAGFAAGPPVAGVLAQWGPAPTVLPYLPHLALLLIALPLLAGTPETRTTHTPGPVRLYPRLPPGRMRTVVAPLAPWVFGSASIGLAYLPGLVGSRLAGHALVFSACSAMLTALAGILVQPLVRRVDRPGSPRLLTTALGLVVAGLLVAAGAAATYAPWLVAVAAFVLGAGYGAAQVCGLLEVQRLARPAELATLTALYQALSYLGFAAPFLLAAAQSAVPPGVLLLVAAGLAGLTLAWTRLHHNHTENNHD
ncbi:MFS transporter [Streptomyces sp. NPDC041068]|uniref:MFS transporter n=1 Tax=Streptomyces sp. NPDC041068 TaxID=3155130 RepID=UPI0033CFEB7D